MNIFHISQTLASSSDLDFVQTVVDGDTVDLYCTAISVTFRLKNSSENQIAIYMKTDSDFRRLITVTNEVHATIVILDCAWACYADNQRVTSPWQSYLDASREISK